MKAKEVARLLEFIKYFTLIKKEILITTNNDVDKIERIEDSHIELSGRVFNIKSFIYDFGTEYSSTLEKKEMNVYFGKCPIVGEIIGTGPDYKYKIVNSPDGLMTPAIIQDYIEDSKSYKRYIFPSNQDNTYSQEFKTYNEWYNTFSFVDIDKIYSRNRSISIVVEQSSIPGFESFMNESLSDWRSRFILDKFDAIEGDFDRFILYDPRIYEYELDFEDRKSILNKLVFSTNWYLTFDFLSDKYELFIYLINNTSKDDGAALYNYMFTIDASSSKTNQEVYKGILPAKLYDELMRVLMVYFYSSKTPSQFSGVISRFRFYPIGLEEFGPWTIPLKKYFDLKEDHEDGTGYFRRGVKYKIEMTNDSYLKLQIKSVIQYRYNFLLNRVEYKGFDFIGNGEEWNFDDIIFVSPYLANQEIKGLNIPHGSVIPIPAFALPWLIEQNDSTEDIIDLMEKAATIAGVVFPVLEIFEGVNILYNVIGLGFTLTGNILDAGLKDQILRYDSYKSGILGHPYTKGSDFLETYYLFSSIYGGISLKKAIQDAKTTKDKIKLLLDFETLMTAKGTLDDFKDFMDLHYPSENLESFNIIKNEMNQLQIDYESYKFLKNRL